MILSLAQARLLATSFTRQLAHPRRLALPLGAAALVAVAAVASVTQSDPAGADFAFATAVRDLHLGFLMPFVSLFYAMAVVGDELDRGTLTWVLLRPVPRRAFLLGRALAAWLLAVLVQAPALAAILVAPALADLPIDPALGDHVLVTLLGTATYVALYLLVSLVFRRGFFVGLVHIGLVEFVVGLVPGRVGYLALRAHLANLLGLRDAGAANPLTAALHSPLPTADSLAVLAVVGALALWASLVLFAGKELAAERTDEAQ